MPTSTIGDELKISSGGLAIAYGLAANREAAVLLAGHAADSVIWTGEKTGSWTTSNYYGEKAREWINVYSSTRSRPGKEKTQQNDVVSNTSVNCMINNAIGRDEVIDFLSVTLSAIDGNIDVQRMDLETVHRGLDKALASLTTRIEQAVGANWVPFVFTNMRYTEDPKVDYAKHRIPTGTLYINRTANLLNMCLGATYGQARYVEICYRNQICLNRKLIEDGLLSYEDVISRSKDSLIQIAGIRNTIESPYNPVVSGDLPIEVAPGWQLYNEDDQDNYVARASFVPFPIILYEIGIKPQRINLLMTIDRIASAIAKSIQIRVPNACKLAPFQQAPYNRTSYSRLLKSY